MAEVVGEPQQHEDATKQVDASSAKKSVPPPITSSFSSLSLSIWPPSQRTRDAVLGRLVQTLTTPSVLTKRYGTFPSDEADAAARRIEEEAFGMASASFDQKEGGRAEDDDGMDILQIYSKEISKKMLDAVKARASASATVTDSAAANGSGTASNATEPEVTDGASSAEGAVEEEAATAGSEVSTQTS